MQLLTAELAAGWLRERVSGSLSTDSRQIGQGDGFIAWPGSASDGRRYVSDVLASGAGACLVEYEGSVAYDFHNEKVAAYSGLKAHAGSIAAAYYDQPSRHLKVVAVTGTNGKTTTAWWLAQALGKLGQKCGVMGTLGIGEPGAMVANGLTTPDPVLLQQQLRRFVDQGFKACALEASSIGLAEHRLNDTSIQVAVFTNFTQDHLDYHGSMQDYWTAKEMLFRWTALKAAVINIDDIKGVELNTLLAESTVDVWTFSCVGPARLQASQIRQDALTLSFEVSEGSERHRIATSMVGHYNVANMLAVITVLRSMNIKLVDALGACADLLPVPGRMDMLAIEGLPLVVIDYAHTPDALEKVLLALQPVAQIRSGQLWCVFGCGGDRDATKRPLMADAAQKNADLIVVTSDNPRSEPADAVISQILPGFTDCSSVHIEADRALAIAQTIKRARPGDVVLLAGKGHENYQEVCGIKHAFSDRMHAQMALNAVLVTRVAAGAAP